MSTQEGRAVAAAFRDGVSCRRARTTTDGQVVLLFGNRIAWRDDKGMVWLTLCGWPGPTTRDRLNAITVALDVDEGFSKQRGVSFFGGRKLIMEIEFNERHSADVTNNAEIADGWWTVVGWTNKLREAVGNMPMVSGAKVQVLMLEDMH